MQGPENRHQEASVEPVPLLALSGLTRSYDGVQALAGVDLDLHAGRIHALVGENGAGKSTLIGILAGTVRPDAGVLRWSPRCAGRIAVVHQHSVATSHHRRESGGSPRLSPHRVGQYRLAQAACHR